MVADRLQLRLVQARRLAERVANLPVRAGGPTGRRIILHVGPHRTGTTTIQHTMTANRTRFPRGVGIMTRETPELAALSGLIHSTHTPRAARRRKEQVGEAARAVAALCKTRTTLVSDEDLLGVLPTRKRLRGLYPFMEELFPPVLEALAESGAQVVVAWTPRLYADWLESLYHQRHRTRTITSFRPRRFRFNNGLPSDWTPFADRLAVVCGAAELVTLSFEQDVKSGIMGEGLFRLAGLSDRDIARLVHSSPKNVSRQRRASDAARLAIGAHMPTGKETR